MITRSNTYEYFSQFKYELEEINKSAYNFLRLKNPTYDTCKLIKQKFPDIWNLKET